jgi:hypothetical protein
MRREKEEGFEGSARLPRLVQGPSGSIREAAASVGGERKLFLRHSTETASRLNGKKVSIEVSEGESRPFYQQSIVVAPDARQGDLGQAA